MATLQTTFTAPRRIRGMSLIEILVGLVIGLLGILVIFQVLSVTEDRKRTTVHGSDAQTAGAIALYQMQRDIQLAGYGFGNAATTLMGCTVKTWNGTAVTDMPFYPVQIVQGASGATDTLRVLYGSSDQFVTARDWTASGTNKSMTGGRGGFDYGDLVVLTSTGNSASSTTPCALVLVTTRPTAQPNDIGHDIAYPSPLPTGDTVSPLAAKPSRFNSATWPASAPFTATAGFAFNLGKQPRRMEWRVTLPGEANPNRLTAGDLLFGTAAQEVADGIVNMQAEYGIDVNNNQLIEDNEWTETAPNNALVPSDLNNSCGDNPSRSWRCVRAIRVALLARSAQWDKTVCSPNPQRTSGAGGAITRVNFTMTNVDGSAPSGADAACTEDPPSPNNWRRYRYSVYETVIPLRNMIWGAAP
jgi:type IV pilus assembly protein PilW